MRNVVAIKNQPKLPEKVSIFITKKLSLIASIANIYYQLKENCVPYYTIYAKHIEKVFGADSI